MQQSKAYVIKSANARLKATIARARKAEYVAYRYGPAYARANTVTLPYQRSK